MSAQTEDLPDRRYLAILYNTQFYRTGKHCVHGHFSKRYTSTGSCFACHEGLPADVQVNSLTRKEARALRAKARENRERHYHGMSCGCCSGTLRYVSTNQCVPCLTGRVRLLAESRKKAGA